MAFTIIYQCKKKKMYKYAHLWHRTTQETHTIHGITLHVYFIVLKTNNNNNHKNVRLKLYLFFKLFRFFFITLMCVSVCVSSTLGGETFFHIFLTLFVRSYIILSV